METYWIFHLAASWRCYSSPSPALNPPLAAGAMFPTAPPSCLDTARTALHGSQPVQDTMQSSIRAAAVQMVFASRSSQDFITPEHVSKLEAWSGQAVLEALRAMDIPQDVCVKVLESISHMTNIFDLCSVCTPKKGVFGTQKVFR